MNAQTALLYKYTEDLNRKEVLIAGAGVSMLVIIAVIILKQGRATQSNTDTTENLTQIINNNAATTTAAKTTTTAPAANKNKIETILKKAAGYGYERGTGKTTAEALIKYKKGDCWAMSDYLFNEIKKAGFRVREIQYITMESTAHRTIQLYNKNKKAWEDLPYKYYKFPVSFRPTRFKPGMFVRREFKG